MSPTEASGDPESVGHPPGRVTEAGIFLIGRRQLHRRQRVQRRDHVPVHIEREEELIVERVLVRVEEAGQPFAPAARGRCQADLRSEEPTYELQYIRGISYAVF